MNQNLQPTLQQINDALRRCPDKDWNYSRITLQLRPLTQADSPYLLWVEHIVTTQKSGKGELASLKSELTWGGRHSDELGILEIISLRINKALLEHTSDEFWTDHRPVIRTVSKQELEAQGITEAFWYHVEEVVGNDFENR